jgi:hypothetical protein
VLQTSRELGLFLLACGFHGPAQATTLTLSHPDSDIRRIVVTADEVTLAEQWRTRDTIWIEEFSRGEFRFAELLLNAGCSWNTVREYSLEGDAGYRGVAPMSAGFRIFLPGSHAWGWDGDQIPIPDICS